MFFYATGTFFSANGSGTVDLVKGSIHEGLIDGLFTWIDGDNGIANGGKRESSSELQHKISARSTSLNCYM